MSWSSSDRRSRLPNDWSKRRLKVKDRAKGRCQALEHEPECDGIGNECDHIIANDDHSLTNLQWLSTPCHKAKTQREAKAAAYKVARRRPRIEQHPGVIS